MLEVDLVVLDPADGEAQVHLERPDVGVDLVRRREIDVFEASEDLVPLRHVPLVEAVVRVDRGTGDPVELTQRGLQLARPDLHEVRHPGAPWARGGTSRSISFSKA